MSAEQAAMNAAAAERDAWNQQAEAMAVDAPTTPLQEPAAMLAAGLDGGALPGTTGQPSSSGIQVPPTALEAPLAQMASILQVIADDKKRSAHWMASGKLDENYFRSIVKFDNTKSSWKEWRRHFLNAVRDCDDSFSDLIEGLEKSPTPIDNLSSYSNATQVQQSTNLYNRLIGCTTGIAFQIVESVPLHNGGEAWRLLNNWFDPKTDARLTSLVLGIIGYKIKRERCPWRPGPVGEPSVDALERPQ